MEITIAVSRIGVEERRLGEAAGSRGFR